MKSYCLLFIFIFLANYSFAQSSKEFTNALSVQSYLDFTKSGTQSAVWLTYDYKKISVEARYNYDWDNNVSLYAGWFLKSGNWKLRLHQGVTFGNTTGLSFSPTVILDKKKIFLFNQPQYVAGLSKMPSYFSHWGEFYYKPTNAIWLGITDRIYFDNTYKDIAFGPQILLSYKNLFVTFYWWIPTRQTESKAFLLAGYEHDFQRPL